MIDIDGIDHLKMINICLGELEEAHKKKDEKEFEEKFSSLSFQVGIILGKLSRLKKLEEIAKDESLLEIGRLEVENILVMMRDARISAFNRNNGIVIKEKDGKESSVIRMGPETCIQIGLQAIAHHLSRKEKNGK
jgi:hypothetical protein